MDKSALEALVGRLEFWSWFFGVIVVIGVAGESIFGIRLLWNNGKLQQLQATENETQRGEIARLAKESSSHQLEIARANERAEEAKARAAEANEKAEHERLERMKIEWRLAHRRLTAEDQKQIAAKLAPFGPIKIAIFEPKVDSEIRMLAHDIASALRQAKWDATIASKSDFGRVVVGVVVEINEEDAEASPETKNAALALTGALRAQRVFTIGPSSRHKGVWSSLSATNPGDLEAPIHVIVGDKPDFAAQAR